MEITEIKQRLSIETVLKHYNLQADKNGMLKCPFHADETASLKIYKQTNTFNCFGCGKNGDAIEFCSIKENSKHKGILKAAELSCLPAETKVKTGEPKQNKSMPAETNEKGGNHTEILSKIFSYFQKGLNSGTTKRPTAYLKSRAINQDVLELGYNSGQFHHRGKLNKEDTKACIDAGLLIPYNGSIPKATGANHHGGQAYTTFAKDCIIFPLKNKENQIVSIYGRSIANLPDGKAGNDKSKPASAKAPAGRHYYLKDRTGLYPNYPNPSTTKLILTEAIIDAATLRQAQGTQQSGILSEVEILSCYGTNGLTGEHLQAIKDLQKLEEVIFFFDGDKAAAEAIKKYTGELLQELQDVKLSVVETPENEDVNSLSVAYDTEIFIHLLEDRKPVLPAGRDLFLLNEKTEKSGAPTDNKKNEKPLRAIGKLNTRNPEPVESSSRIPLKINFSNEQFITYTTEELQIIILGGINLQQLDRLRITIKISRTDTADPLHSIRHTLDLYHSDYLEKFINKASEQLETGTNVFRRAIAELTDQIEQYRLSKLESLKEQKPKERQLTEQRQRRAINYLRAPKLMERTNKDIGITGMIGEENNRLLMYLVFTSRLREQPLHIISLGASGTGKTYLQEKISELIPEQDKLEITILSENAFYYFDRKELKNKLVLIEDMDGAENVLYPLRELQSKMKISKTIPIKDNKGNLKTITLQVEGPICLAGTTTKERLYEDNANRSLLVYLDGSTEHKEHIMEYQRKLSAGKINNKEENQLKEFFKDMQTVLKPIKVRNPYAEYLKLPESVFKPLRTNAHYLAVIETITFYHQYQREIKTTGSHGEPVEPYIETTLEDIEWANKLLKDVLLAKADELSGECRRFFESLKTWLKNTNQESFYKKDVREAFRMNPNNLKYYLVQLLKYNYLKIVGGNRHKSGYEYEIINTEEYKMLNQNLTNALDTVLNDIKKSLVGSVDNKRVIDAVTHSSS